ncbi:MAG: pyruvate formate-lyase, partial [Clostridia bacterium]|nr:pyruvate formate-lyase [Clostridia bacterium]
KDALSRQKPVFRPADRIGFHFSFFRDSFTRHRAGNLTPDYPRLLQGGFAGLREEIALSRPAADEEGLAFLDCASASLDAMKVFAERYRLAAEKAGHEELAAALAVVPERPPETFHQALVLLKFLHMCLRAADVDHIGFGRFDQYLWPLYQKARAEGAARADMLEWVEEFFLSVNYDTFLFHGIQQGDNGQSLVLGGFDENGGECFNELSEVCLEAAEELSLIDPKINLRVGKNTDPRVYELGTRLTRKGLGFPQYSNDDVVIPGLVRLGYDPADAREYVVAACWEFIVPGCGADEPNVRIMDYPAVVRRATLSELVKSKSFDEFLAAVRASFLAECADLEKSLESRRPVLNPVMSVFVTPCLRRARMARNGGAKYENAGFHGLSVAGGADALLAVKKAVFEEKIVSPAELCAALEDDFAGREDLRRRLLAYPKMGRGSDEAVELASFLMDAVADGLQGRRYKATGGIIRSGTGSAFHYVEKGRALGATADGRKAGAFYPSSFSPTLTASVSGPLSVVRDFSAPDMTRTVNGGPLTMELHQTLFRSEEGVKKVAALVRAFILRGGHQLQLNAVDRAILLDARAHLENHRDLIVRVWGWSAYFVELDPAYQDHIIARHEFGADR